MIVFMTSDGENSEDEEENNPKSDLDGGLEGGAVAGFTGTAGSAGTTHAAAPDDGCRTTRMM